MSRVLKSGARWVDAPAVYGPRQTLYNRKYRSRNAIERMFCRLEDFRRVATHYDRLATNFMAAVCIAAVSYRS